ncbi:MAG: Rab family GTPase [Promethearchaeota archaeon]
MIIVVVSNQEKQVDFKLKISFIGDEMTGKTSLILRYVKNHFKEDLKSTIGTNFMIKRLEIEGKSIQLLIYDIGAQKIFTSMRAKYFQGSNASIAVFDVTNLHSLHGLPDWINSLREVCGNLPITIVGNKVDLQDSREVSDAEARNLASRFNCDYDEASAKTGEHVELIFENLARDCLEYLGYL